MPVYDYRCPNCQNTRTATVSIEEETKQTCVCGTDMNKVYFAPPIIFKGNGWANKDK